MPRKSQSRTTNPLPHIRDDNTSMASSNFNGSVFQSPLNRSRGISAFNSHHHSNPFNHGNNHSVDLTDNPSMMHSMGNSSFSGFGSRTNSRTKKKGNDLFLFDDKWMQ